MSSPSPMDSDDKPKVSITLRTIVTGPEAGSIIGRGGDTVNSIRQESGAKIKIEGSSPQERIITVDGPTDSIFKAYTLICKTLESRERQQDRERSRERDRDRDSERSEGLHLNLLVPTGQCGAIIGKEGVKIKEIRSTTGATIHVSADSLPGSSERCVKVSGSREEVTQCIYHICCALLESTPKGETKLYRPDRGFSEQASTSGGRGRDRGGMDSGYGSRGIGRDRDRSRDRDRDRYDSYDSYSRRERSPYGGGYGGSSSGGYSNPFEQIADFARRQGGGRRRASSRDRDQRYEMNVPNDVIGSVIGRGGSKINEIRQISGASINIMEVGQGSRGRRDRSPLEQDRDRQIEIVGSTEAVALAKSLINMAMDLGDRQEGGQQDRGRARGWPRDTDRRARTRSRSRGYDDRRGRRGKFEDY